MWRRSRRQLMILFFLFSALPVLAANGIWFFDHCRTVRSLAAADLADEVERGAEEVNARLALAVEEFDRLVTVGFASLSTASLAVRPGLGLLEARLRSPESVLPLGTPFDRLAIHRSQGELLWIAEGPLPGDGGARFTDVRAAVPGRTDSNSVAAAVEADGAVVVRRGVDRESLRLARFFRTDPYDSSFVMTAELPLAHLLDGVAHAAGRGDVAPAGRAPLTWRGGGPVASVAKSSGAWHEEILTASAAAERVDIVIEGAIAMRPHYRVVVRRMGWVVAGTLLVVVLGAFIAGRWT